MKKYLLVFAILFTVSLLCYAVDHHRWPIKTQPGQKTKPRTLNLSDVITLPDPPGVTMNDKRYEEKRIPAFTNPKNVKEGDLVKVEGYMHLVAFEGNDDEYHIQISGSKTSGDDCLIVEVPDPKNVDDAALKAKYEKVRSFIREKILHPDAKIIAGKFEQEMPKTELSDQEVEEIVEYLQTLK